MFCGFFPVPVVVDAAFYRPVRTSPVPIRCQLRLLPVDVSGRRAFATAVARSSVGARKQAGQPCRAQRPDKAASCSMGANRHDGVVHPTFVARSDPASYPTKPLASFQTYRLSGWNPPPLWILRLRGALRRMDVTQRARSRSTPIT